MIFNKKLIALAIAFTCATSTFASDKWQIEIPTDFAGARKMAFNGSVAATRWTVDTAYDLGVKADNLSGQRLSAVSSWAFGYVQSVDDILKARVSLYSSLRGRGIDLYTSVHDTLYPKSA